MVQKLKVRYAEYTLTRGNLTEEMVTKETELLASYERLKSAAEM